MKLSFLTASCLIAWVTPTFAAPQPIAQKRAPCINPLLRKNWHSATAEERTSCAHIAGGSFAPLLKYSTDWIIASRTPRVHAVASFLPWHRYFINLYEIELRACGHTGALLYWDWEESSNTYPDVRDDPIWTASHVGGNGVITTDEVAQCLVDGPFVNLRPAWYRGQWAPKCVTRQFSPPDQIHSTPRWMLAQWYTTFMMDGIRNTASYNFFRLGLEGRGHSHVHGGVGGDMSPMDSSPNDPVFFLHHTNVDRIWWNWQQQDPVSRNYAYGGWEGAGVLQGNLSHPLRMSGFAPDMTVQDYMVSENDFQCYRY